MIDKIGISAFAFAGDAVTNNFVVTRFGDKLFDDGLNHLLAHNFLRVHDTHRHGATRFHIEKASKFL